MKVLISTRLSKHKYKTPEGYLICQDAVLARTGKQTYRRSEVFGDSTHDADEEIEVDRLPEEVFSEATLASFENKPVTSEHPDEDVTINNFKEYAVGFARDIRKGTDDGKDVILGTLVITDPQAVDDIESGRLTDLSCGYECDVTDDEHPQQKNIRGNHVALCEQGRAGNARIIDSVNDIPARAWTSYDRAKYKLEEYDAYLDFSAGDKSGDPTLAGKVGVVYERNGKQNILNWVDEATAKKLATDLKLKQHGDRFTKDAEEDYEVSYDVVPDDADDWVAQARQFGIKTVVKKKSPMSTIITFSGTESKMRNFLRATDLEDSVKDSAKLPKDLRNRISKYLAAISTYTSNRQADAADIVKTLERQFNVKLTRESIDGWKKMNDGMMRKDYVFSIEGYDDELMISMYANPETYDTTEFNAFFNDSVTDSEYDVATRAFNGLITSFGMSNYKKVVAEAKSMLKEHKKDPEWQRAYNDWIGVDPAMKKAKALKDEKTLHDKLIDPDRSIINKVLDIAEHFRWKLDKQGHTFTGRTHLEFIPLDADADGKVDKFVDMASEWCEKLGYPTTFSANSQRAVIDIDKKYVKDSTNVVDLKRMPEYKRIEQRLIDECDRWSTDKGYDLMNVYTKTSASDPDGAEIDVYCDNDDIRDKHVADILIDWDSNKRQFYVDDLGLKIQQLKDEVSNFAESVVDLINKNVTHDSVKDAVLRQEYRIQWWNKHSNKEGVFTVTAESIHEALTKMSEQRIGGPDFAVFIDSIKPDDNKSELRGYRSQLLKDPMLQDSVKDDMTVYLLEDKTTGEVDWTHDMYSQRIAEQTAMQRSKKTGHNVVVKYMNYDDYRKKMRGKDSVKDEKFEGVVTWNHMYYAQTSNNKVKKKFYKAANSNFSDKQEISADEYFNIAEKYYKMFGYDSLRTFKVNGKIVKAKDEIDAVKKAKI